MSRSGWKIATTIIMLKPVQQNECCCALTAAGSVIMAPIISQKVLLCTLSIITEELRMTFTKSR